MRTARRVKRLVTREIGDKDIKSIIDTSTYDTNNKIYE